MENNPQNTLWQHGVSSSSEGAQPPSAPQKEVDSKQPQTGLPEESVSTHGQTPSSQAPPAYQNFSSKPSSDTGGGSYPGTSNTQATDEFNRMAGGQDFATTPPMQEPFGGPQFGAPAQPFPSQTNTEEDDTGNIGSMINDAKSNGWGLRFQSWLFENKQFPFLLGAAAILAALFFTMQMQPTLYTNLRTLIGGADSESTSGGQVQGGVFGESFPLSQSVPLRDINIALSPEGLVVETETPTVPFGKGAVVTQEAAGGEGITHLARRAITQRLEEIGVTLTPEQRIYAEDYVQNAIGNYGLNQGEQLSFTHGLLDEAISRSGELTPTQLQNLTQYTSNVAAF